jgi:hypothetical protein
MGQQVTIAASQVDKERLGYNGISLTHSAIGDTAEPNIAAGSKVEVGGALYEFTIDEAGTGWAGLTASAIAYIRVVPAGASISWIYTNTAPTWDTAKQGWYTGTDRVVAMLYKDAASLYQFKNLIPAGQAPLFFDAAITSTVNPFVFNLPASSGTGRRIRVTCTSIVNTGLVSIVPSGTDQIGSAGNVTCFLQNVDQSTYIYKHQNLDIVDSRSGYWAVVGGQLCPDNATDTDGQQYHLGKLHHLPLANTTDRRLTGGDLTPTAGASWYGSAITGAGVYGIPAGAKAIRVAVRNEVYATAAGEYSIYLAFSDNNANTPTMATAHPKSENKGYKSAAGLMIRMVEIDIPLNSSGQFYMYTIATLNATVASSLVGLVVMGFYMGD